MKITLNQLKSLLNEQKELVIKKLQAESYLYNPKSTAGHAYTLELNWDEFKKRGMAAPYPDDIQVLERYKIKDE